MRKALPLPVVLACFLLGTAWLAATQTQNTSTPLAAARVTDDLYVIEGTSKGSGDAGNVAVHLTSDGVIVVDDRFDRDYQDILAKVKSLAALPVKYIVNINLRTVDGMMAEFKR